MPRFSATWTIARAFSHWSVLGVNVFCDPYSATGSSWPQVTDAYGFEDVGLAEAFALALALADAEAEAEADADAEALAEAFAEADIFTEVALGTVVVCAALGCALAVVAWTGTASAVAGWGALLGACPLIVIAAATPPGAPTTVPASAATVIAGYFRVQDWLASERTIGDLRLCLAL
jgi:hypothetical protein